MNEKQLREIEEISRKIMKRFSEVKEIKFVLEEMSNFDKQTLLGDIEEIIEESLRKKWATWL